MKLNKILIILTGLLMVFGCKKDNSSNEPKVVATVFDQIVTIDELNQELEKYLSGLPQDYEMTDEELKEIKPQLLDAIIDKKMYMVEMDKLQIPVDNEIVESRYRQLLMEFGSEEKTREYIANFGFTLEELFDEFAFQTRVNNLSLYAENLDYQISEEKALEFYEQNKETVFVIRGSVSASHILIPTEEGEEEALNKIKSIEAEILNGLAFDQAARNYSTCPSSESGGDLGSFKKGQMVPEFENVAFGLNVGQMSPPVLTQFGYHLIKLDNKIEDEISPFSEAKDFIIKHLIKEAYFTELAERANITKINLEEI